MVNDHLTTLIADRNIFWLSMKMNDLWHERYNSYAVPTSSISLISPIHSLSPWVTTDPAKRQSASQYSSIQSDTQPPAPDKRLPKTACAIVSWRCWGRYKHVICSTGLLRWFVSLWALVIRHLGRWSGHFELCGVVQGTVMSPSLNAARWRRRKTLNAAAERR